MTKQELRVDVHLSRDMLSKSLHIPKGTIPEISGVCLDTRCVRKGDLFVAIAAARDGHDFVDEALKKGAACALVHEQRNYHGPTLSCGNTYKSFTMLANQHRHAWGRTVIGISGSNGKTTTKQILSALLGAYKATLMSPGTWNNHLGVPLTLFLLKDEHQFAVLEMGMNHAQELADLSDISEPNVGILTGIGKAHIEHFGTLDAIADAKWELMQGLVSDGVAVINIDDPYIYERSQSLERKKIYVSTKNEADVWCSQLQRLGNEGYAFTLHYGKQGMNLKTKLLGRHNISNLMCALGAAYSLGVPSAKLQAGIDHIEVPDMRMQRVALANDVLLIEDCYNANPTSAEAAIEVMREFEAARKIIVIGDMLELGLQAAQSHRDIGRKAAQAGIKYIFSVGQYAHDVAQGAVEGGLDSGSIHAFKSKDDLTKHLNEFLRSGDLILIKGSRGIKLETVSASLIASFGRKA